MLEAKLEYSTVCRVSTIKEYGLEEERPGGLISAPLLVGADHSSLGLRTGFQFQCQQAYEHPTVDLGYVTLVQVENYMGEKGDAGASDDGRTAPICPQPHHGQEWVAPDCKGRAPKKQPPGLVG